MELNWQAIGDEAITHLRALLRLNTTNPPGNEILCAQYLREVLEREGIESTLIEAAPGRANLVARLSGTGKAGGPLLLTGHTDVVPAEPQHWRFDPFSGEIADGYIWGRGAVDMKQIVAANLMAMLLLKRSGASLSRDLIFAAVADEEAGCTYGSKWLVEEHPELVQAEYGLNEIGGFQLHINGKRIYPIQVAEKGVVWLKLTTHGAPGHGSMPHGDNAVCKLARAIDRLARNPLPVHVHPVSKAFLDNLADALGYPAKALLTLLTKPALSDYALRLLPDKEKAKAFNAMLRNTATPTVLEAGRKENVIPGQATVTLDCRILPGQTRADLLRELRAAIGEPVEIEILLEAPPHTVQADTPLYRLIEGVLKERDPAGIVTPYLVVGFTDAAYYHRLGTTMYGFSPLQLPPELSFTELFHGHNERVPIEGFRWGVRTFYDVVSRFVGAAH